MKSPIIIIPARLSSTRLPGKPLADIAGIPMVVHVLRAAQAAHIGRVVVAAAEQEICEAVRNAGGEAVLTAPDLPSGSDRVWHAVQQIDPDAQHDLIINLQGDLPTFPADYLKTLLQVMTCSAYDIGTLVAPIDSDEEKLAPSVVKVACSFRNKTANSSAIYFSRMPIPWGEGAFWHHIGVYCWRRKALEQFISLPPSGLETRESLEQLRALEAGLRIGCARVDHAPFGVDTPQDLERARRALTETAQ